MFIILTYLFSVFILNGMEIKVFPDKAPEAPLFMCLKCYAMFYTADDLQKHLRTSKPCCPFNILVKPRKK